MRIQMLGIIADDAVPSGLLKEATAVEPVAPAETRIFGLLSPKLEAEREPTPKPAGRPLKDPPVNLIPTPPIESLPFLSSSSSLQYETFEDISEDDDLTRLLHRKFEKASWDYRDELEGLYDEFASAYRPWKTMISEIELRSREENPVTPAPASPPLSIGPSLAPTPLIERTRGAKNTTELDFQNILRESERSAREEQERRDREATSKPNYETEAIIPYMLDPVAAELSCFKDTNQLVPPEMAIEVFAFVPPKDDFTAEEQITFISAFNLNPKRWGKISESLPGRDYQQCIMHYYLTKDKAKYKEGWRKTLPRKGRKKGTVPRPRSTALMSDIVYDGEEMEPIPAAVTDTGRPRRAAAPTFGDIGPDTESSTPAPTSTRRATAKDTPGDLAVEKPTRGRKSGTGQKGSRKSKGQAQQAQQVQLVAVAGLSSPKIDREILQSTKVGRGNSKTDTSTIASEEVSGVDFQKAIDLDIDRGRSGPFSVDGAGGASTSIGSAAPQTSSYWSVPEQQKFPSLLAYFGRDFEAIATFMRTKTMTMVCLDASSSSHY